MTARKKAYARAGVDVDLGNRLKRQIQSLVKQTHRPQVLSKIGGFGGLFRANFPGIRAPVLVASIDGVGTKLKIAFALNKHDTVGADLVNHCVNDIAVLGARPLFFLDYIGAEKLSRAFSRSCWVDLPRPVARLVARSSAVKPRKCRECINGGSTIWQVASLAWSIAARSSTEAGSELAMWFSDSRRTDCTPMVIRSRAKSCLKD